MSNFDFLQKKFPSLARFGRLAERYWSSDPSSSLIKMGQLGETMVRLIFDYEHIQETSWDNNAAQKINQLRDDGWITPDLSGIFHVLRKFRNKAAHDDYGTADDARRLLPLAYSLSEWFMETYGDWQYVPRPFAWPPSGAGNASLTPADKEIEEKEDEESTARDRQAAERAERIAPDRRKAQAAKAAKERKKPEEEARLLIDDQLRQAGWEADTEHIRYSKGIRPVKGRNMAIAEWPVEGGERADYALFAGLTLVGIIEAKKKTTAVSSALDGQCDDYARHIIIDNPKWSAGTFGPYRVPFAFASNGGPCFEDPALEALSGLWFRDLRTPEERGHAVASWMSPQGLLDKLAMSTEDADHALASMNFDFLKDPRGLSLRPYQMEAVEAALSAIRTGKKDVLLALATGTGKTRIALGLIYVLLKARRFHRILFLVDRTLLGEQAMERFQGSRLEKGQTLASIYDVREIGDISLEPDTRVQVATVQSLMGRFRRAGEDGEPPLSVSDYDLIIADEAHRGYSLDKDMSDEEALWRNPDDYLSKYKKVLDYYDAVRIGLTATPALQTTEIFGAPVYSYTYSQGVLDGYLADHDEPVKLETELSRKGIHYTKGDTVTVFQKGEGTVTDYTLPDDIDFDVGDFNKKVINASFNRTVVDMLAPYLHPEKREDGKTLIFAVSDAHADQIVTLLKRKFPHLDSRAIRKITGSAEGGNKKKIAALAKRFRNETWPSIAVTVSLLTTGYDAPAITKLVFLRQVKSRILYEQMIGRATRLCEDIHKTHFTIYDACGTTDLMKNVTAMNPVVQTPSMTLSALIEDVKGRTDEKTLPYPLRQIVARLRRAVHAMKKEDRALVESLSGMAPEALISAIEKAPPKEAKALIRDQEKALLSFHSATYDRPVIISPLTDKPAVAEPGETKPQEGAEDYLEAFNRYIATHKNDIAALTLIATRPSGLTLSALGKLSALLATEGFTEEKLNQAEKTRQNRKITADLITYIRRAAIGSALIDHGERVRRAVERLKKTHTFTAAEETWLNRIEQFLLHDSIIYPGAFDEDPRFSDRGGFRTVDRAFQGRLAGLLHELNTYLYDDGGKQA